MKYLKEYQSFQNAHEVIKSVLDMRKKESDNIKRLQEICDESLAYLYDKGVSSRILFFNKRYFIRINLCDPELPPSLKWNDYKDHFIPLIQILDDAVIGIGFVNNYDENGDIYKKEDIINDKNISNYMKYHLINIEVNPDKL